MNFRVGYVKNEEILRPKLQGEGVLLKERNFQLTIRPIVTLELELDC